MSYATLGWVEQYVLSRAKVNSEPDTKTPGKTGMPYPILLGATFISSNLSEMHQLQFAGRATCSLPPRLAISSDNSHCPDHGCVPHKPCNDGMTDRNMGFDVVLKTHL